MSKQCIDCGRLIPEYMQYCPKCANIRGIDVTVAKKQDDEKREEKHGGKCNLITAYIRMFKNFYTAQGRSRRSEYWYVYIIDLIFRIFLTSLLQSSRVQVEVIPGYYASVASGVTWVLVFVAVIYGLTMNWAVICLTIRRLHDVGKSGWWCLLKFLFIGEIVLAVFLVRDSQIGRNIYGEDPKAQERERLIKETEHQLNTETTTQDYNLNISEEKIDVFYEKYPPSIRKEKRVSEENLEIIKPQIVKKENISLKANNLSQKDQETAFCRKCGTQLLKDSEFCHKCGCEKVR